VKKSNPDRYSSAVGAIWVMVTFKIKFCHKLFDILGVRELAEALLNEAISLYEIECKKIAFDSDHVHLILEMGLYGKIELAKKLKGYVGKKIFEYMPWLKKNKWEGGYFWNTGFWNPSYDVRNVNDLEIYMRYLDKQKYSAKGQKTLALY
jgi:REP element-mobilizing transposase RayT